MTVIFAPVWYLIGTFQQNFYSFALLCYVNFWCLWFSLQSFIHNWSWPAGFGQTYLSTNLRLTGWVVPEKEIFGGKNFGLLNCWRGGNLMSLVCDNYWKSVNTYLGVHNLCAENSKKVKRMFRVKSSSCTPLTWWPSWFSWLSWLSWLNWLSWGATTAIGFSWRSFFYLTFFTLLECSVCCSVTNSSTFASLNNDV